jgi:hypothetical protein
MRMSLKTTAKSINGQKMMGKMTASGQQHTRMPSAVKMDGSHSMELGSPTCMNRTQKPQMTPAKYAKRIKDARNVLNG